MSPKSSVLAAAALAFLGAGSVQAADWGVGNYDPGFKPSYPLDYAAPDPLSFEAGIRYFYGRGGQSFSLGGNTYSATDTSHSLEAHLRIDDHSTATYLKGHVGFGSITDGQFMVNGAQNGAYQTGRVAYGVADFGYTPIDTGVVRLGFFGGYQYTNESPQDVGLDIHSLRLGVSGRAEFGGVFDITAEAAAIPYSYVTGSIRNPAETLAGVAGSLYGGSAEVMVGFHPTDMFTVRGGVRGTLLNGPVTATNHPGEHWIETFRWGPVVELTARF